MNRLQTIPLAITMIATPLCCLLIADAHSDHEEKPTDNCEKDDTDDTTDGTFDFFTNGDDNLQSLNFMFELPISFNESEPTCKHKQIEASFSGKYFVTFSKPDLPDDVSILDSFVKQLSDMRTVSETFALRLEGSTLSQLGLGGYIEMESDYSITTDPHLHFTSYAQYALCSFVKVALGGWAEARRLGKKPSENGRYRYGLRTHLDIEHNTKKTAFSMMIEYLPHLNFDKYRVSASPEFELKFKAFGKQLGLVFHTEIDYYSENTDLTVEPLLDLKPWEIRWTQLIRHRF